MQPLWFRLLKNWKNNGHSALTLPYLIGANARSRQEGTGTIQDARQILDEMVAGVEDDLAVYIRPCPDQEQVMCELLTRTESRDREQYDLMSLAIASQRTRFTTILIAPSVAKRWDNNASAVLAGLIEVVAPLISSGKFSWVLDGPHYTWGPYESHEIKFIDAVIKQAKSEA